MTKQAINRHLARAEALGDETLSKITGTSLDASLMHAYSPKKAGTRSSGNELHRKCAFYVAHLQQSHIERYSDISI